MSELEELEKFILLTKTAQTRSGASFVFDSFNRAQGEKKEVTAIGKVFQKGPIEKLEIPFFIEWDLKGNALSLGKEYDLVTEIPFDDA